MRVADRNVSQVLERGGAGRLVCGEAPPQLQPLPSLRCCAPESFAGCRLAPGPREHRSLLWGSARSAEKQLDGFV